MNYERVLGHLASSACPSIRYRTKKDILGEPAESPAMLALQEEILKDPVVREIASWQKEDGWLGDHFHGDHGPECGIRHLKEKGVESSHPVIQNALHALRQRSDNFQTTEFCLGHVGRALDEHHAGGSAMMLACAFAYAGVENEAFLQAQIKEALDGFSFVMSVRAVDEIYEQRKNGKLVFRPGVKWPSTYHLRLLAFTKSWRSEGNRRMLAASVGRLAELSPIPPVKVLEKSQIISPASIYMENFRPAMGAMTPKEWMMWFHRAELLARLGVANDVPAIKAQIDFLCGRLDANDGLFTEPLSHFYFTTWTQYIGMALENDWKAAGAKANDLTFRSYLILKMADRL